MYGEGRLTNYRSGLNKCYYESIMVYRGHQTSPIDGVMNGSLYYLYTYTERLPQITMRSLHSLCSKEVTTK